MNNTNINCKILEDIYINLFFKEENIDDDIFNSLVPDYIENNEDKFVNFTLNDYKYFILNLIYPKKNYIQYTNKPSILIIFKLINLLAKKFEDNLIWIYNKTLHKIQYYDPNYYFQNTININSVDKYIDKELNYIIGSSVYEIYNCNLPEEYFYEFCWRLFYIEKKSYHLLVKEFDWIDNNLILNNNKYNNLKFNLFLGVLEQFKILSQTERFDFNSLIDLLDPPNPKSIKFPLYMGVYVYNKLINNKIDDVFINFDNFENDILNIDKFFSLLILLDSKTLEIIFNYIDELNSDVFIDSNTNDINKIFDDMNNFIMSAYDYKTDNNLYDKINNNEIKFSQQLINAYGGGNNFIQIPINALNKIAKYVYYIKQTIE